MKANTHTTEALRAVVEQFQLRGTLVHGAPYGRGHINDTFAIAVADGGPTQRHLLQRINGSIFGDVPRLMENIQRVTQHLRHHLEAAGLPEPDRRTLTLVPSRENRPYVIDETGDYWRTYLFIEGARTFDSLSSAAQAEAAGRAFGRFQTLLADLPAPPLHTTIPRFHDTPDRYRKLEAAIAANTHGRADTAAREIDFVRNRASQLAALTDRLASGELPTRVTHNDTKINNVMIDDNTGEGLCVIDLDTVMPGSALFDIGDQIRTSTGRFQENQEDLSTVRVDLDLYEALMRGYLGEAGSSLTSKEKRLITLAGELIIMTIGLRFLTDYLKGDTYFRTSRPGENLDRARTQLAYVRDLEDNRAVLKRIVERYS